MSDFGSFERLVIESPHIRTRAKVTGSLLADELRFGKNPATIVRQGARALIAVTIGKIDPFPVSVYGMVLETNEDNPGLFTAEFHNFFAEMSTEQVCTEEDCGAGMMEAMSRLSEDEYAKFDPDSMYVTPFLATNGGHTFDMVIRKSYEAATTSGTILAKNPLTHLPAFQAFEYFMSTGHDFSNQVLHDVALTVVQPVMA